LAEKAVLEASDPQGSGLLTIALRPSGIFGPKDGQGSLAMAQAAKRGQWRVYIGANDNLFDMTYVDNVAYAHILAAEKLAKDNGTSGEAFNITNDQPLFFWDIPKALFDGLGYKETMKIRIPRNIGFLLGSISDFMTWILSPIKTLHPSFTHFRVKVITGNRYFDISKANRLLGYKPIVSMEEALKRTVDYWKPEYSASSQA
jgi:sterol-4alpha-carboxylate 3-dehydrogenase (decarboxylating)